MLFDRICRDNGIVHRLTAPASPTTTGKIERFHRTLRDEFLRDRRFSSLEQAQSELDEWIEDYNLHRPHQSLKMATPAERFYAARSTVPTPPLDIHTFNEDRSGDDWVSRTVSISGTISISNRCSAWARCAAATWSTCACCPPCSRSGTAPSSSSPLRD